MSRNKSASLFDDKAGSLDGFFSEARVAGCHVGGLFFLLLCLTTALFGGGGGKSVQDGYITPAFSGSPMLSAGTKSENVTPTVPGAQSSNINACNS